MTTYQLYLLLLGYLTESKCDNKDVIDALLELYKRVDSDGNHSTKEPNKTELYFDDREICKFSYNGECTNMDVHRLINCYLYCDGYTNETCHYRDMKKKTLSEAIVKENFEKAESEELRNCAECDNYGTRECYECKRGSLFIKIKKDDAEKEK